MAQYAVPDADTDTGGWTEFGAGSLFFAQIDETPVGVAGVDDEYITVAETMTMDVDGEAEFELSTITDPEATGDHIVRFRARAAWAGMSVPTLTVLLLEDAGGAGEDEIRSETTGGGTLDALTTSWVDHSFTLTSAEANDITTNTGYGDLSLRITATLGVMQADQVDVSQLFFETGDAPAGGGGTVNSASDNFSLVDNFGNHFSLE